MASLALAQYQTVLLGNGGNNLSTKWQSTSRYSHVNSMQTHTSLYTESMKLILAAAAPRSDIARILGLESEGQGASTAPVCLKILRHSELYALSAILTLAATVCNIFR